MTEDLKDIEIEFDEKYEQKKKRKIKKGFLKFFLFLVVVALIVYLIISDIFKLQVINVTGNQYVSSEEVIKYAKVSEGQNLIFVYLSEISNNIEGHDEIQSAVVNYDSYNQITIEVEEEPVLFKSEQGYYLSSGYLVDLDITQPVVDFNNFEQAIDQELILEELAVLFDNNPEVYEHISQITFEPDNMVEDRLVFFMRDSNRVYIRPSDISRVFKWYFKTVDELHTKYGVVYGEFHYDETIYGETGLFEPYQ